MRQTERYLATLCLVSMSFGGSNFAFLPLPQVASAQKLELSQSRRLTLAMLVPALVSAQGEAYAEEPTYKRLRNIQYFAALGDPKASSGTGAETWGLWLKDPGPRGETLANIGRVQSSKGGVARAGWKFDPTDWYVEEHGLIMEKPAGGDGGSGEAALPGKYLVTGARDVTTTMTIYPPDQNGKMRWELDKGTLYDVTHLPCRTGRYTGPGCSPENAKQSDFPVRPGGLMPDVPGCNKQDYAVVFVIGLPA